MDQIKINKKRRAQAGFTLIEVMVGAFIFMFGCLGMLGLMNYAGMANHDSIQLTQAEAVASSYMDRLINRPEAQMLSGNETNNVTASGETAGAYNSTDGNYAVSWDITNHGRYFTVQVLVRWYDKSKKSTDESGNTINGEWQQYSLSSARQK